MEKVILRVIDEYVRENKRPIRRKELTEYVFAFDERMGTVLMQS
ncbi:hypothetical protein [Stygiolobus caldivivus]|nr:hypothetical protein [Stygiolobus caldivivus]